VTFREAAIQAGKELGMSMENIQAANAHSDRMAPHEVGATNDDIPPGQERVIIDEIKTSMREIWKKRNESN
jgi:hypothetical protein